MPHSLATLQIDATFEEELSGWSRRSNCQKIQRGFTQRIIGPLIVRRAEVTGEIHKGVFSETVVEFNT
jgi:hypothetical protein